MGGMGGAFLKFTQSLIADEYHSGSPVVSLNLIIPAVGETGRSEVVPEAITV
jgi:hypothetical protein